MTPEAALKDLLLSIFSARELRNFLRNGPGGDAIVRLLPSDTASSATLADAAVGSLLQLGRVNSVLFLRLAGERPARRAEISAVEALWAGSAHPAGSTKDKMGATSMAQVQSPAKILFLASNPRGTSRLQLDEEIRRIERSLRESGHGHRLQIVQEWAVRPEDLQSSLLRHQPDIVHFSGHGDSSGQLVLQDDSGRDATIPAAAFGALFRVLHRNIRCVVLNACSSEEQAKAIGENIDVVAYMGGAVSDRAASEFSANFYRALAFGRSVADAFALGRIAIALQGLNEESVPMMTVRAGVDPATVVFFSAESGESKDGGTSDTTADARRRFPRRVFVSYAHADEHLRHELETHLALLRRQGLIETWHDRLVEPGQNWDKVIDEHLKAADIILLLVSPDFLASDYCYDVEVASALERHARGATQVVPILVRPCDWSAAPFGRIQALPRNAKPVTLWEDRDAAWLDVARGIRNVVRNITKEDTASGSAIVSLPASLERELGPRIAIGEIFNATGDPSVTYVAPSQAKLLAATLRTMGKGLVVQGPSGIGKTTATRRALHDIGRAPTTTWISCSHDADVRTLDGILNSGSRDHVVVDDFHRLSVDQQRRVAGYIKRVADVGDRSVKIVLLGVNRIGHTLADLHSDLAGRVDVVKMTRQPDEKILELVLRGEQAANISFARRSEFVERAAGSFSAAQQLCFHAAVEAGIDETQSVLTSVAVGPQDIKERVLESLAYKFRTGLRDFAGYDGHGPVRGGCLALLWLLARDEDGLVVIPEARNQYPALGRAFDWLVAEGLPRCFDTCPGLRDILAFDQSTSVLSVEDPQLFFYLGNLDWVHFARSVGLRVSISDEERIIFRTLGPE